MPHRGRNHLVEHRVDDGAALGVLRHDVGVGAVVLAQDQRTVVLLDVDNGPDWGSFRTNAALYDRRGLAAAKRALCKGGMYAVWSGYPADRFVRRLRAAGFRTSVVAFEERGKLQARAYIGINSSSSDPSGAPTCS